MDKKNKGLADNHDGDIILNESGTSVSFGWDTGESDENDPTSSQQEEGKEKDKPEPSGDTDSRCIS
jgi:hypothetical protein